MAKVEQDLPKAEPLRSRLRRLDAAAGEAPAARGNSQVRYRSGPRELGRGDRKLAQAGPAGAHQQRCPLRRALFEAAILDRQGTRVRDRRTQSTCTRSKAREILADTPGLRSDLQDTLDESYEDGRRRGPSAPRGGRSESAAETLPLYRSIRCSTRTGGRKRSMSVPQAAPFLPIARNFWRRWWRSSAPDGTSSGSSAASRASPTAAIVSSGLRWAPPSGSGMI